MPDLLTLAELKTARGDTTADNDSQLTWFLSVVTPLFRNFTGRDFGSALVTEERSYQYDGSGYLDIDDTATVQAVKLAVPHADDQALDPDFQWTPMPQRRDDSPVYTYLALYGVGQTGHTVSPEMGFNRNLDVYYREHRVPTMPTIIKVTALWGWATVPPDVKQAAIWTINEWVEKDDESEGLTAEAISGYSRSWAQGTDKTALENVAIPGRALAILANYAKLEV